MTESPIERMAHANPVPEPPAVLQFERVRRLVEEDPPSSARRAEQRRRHVRPSRRMLVAFAGLACAALATVLLAIGSSNPSVNVLAEVYAATAPRPGIVESVTVTREYAGSGSRTTERVREWREPLGQHRRRGSIVVTVSGSSASQVADVVYTPRVWESWSTSSTLMLPRCRGRGPGAICRVRWAGSHVPSSQRMGFGVASGLVGEEWTQLFRALYRTHQFSVVGRVLHAGRLVWKLEASPAIAAKRAREDHTQYYVLIDPHTFLPVYTRLIDLARPGHPTMSESELLSYRMLLPSKANEGVFDLRVQHASASVVTQTLHAGATVDRRQFVRSSGISTLRKRQG